MRSCERRDTISPVHPRARRERWFLDDDGDCGDGSSPRVRRTRAAQMTVPCPSRFILARAGNADHRSGAGRQDSVQHIQIRENGGLRFRARSRPCESVLLPAGGRNRPAGSSHSPARSSSRSPIDSADRSERRSLPLIGRPPRRLRSAYSELLRMSARFRHGEPCRPYKTANAER